MNARIYTEQEVRDHHKRYMAGEPLGPMLRKAGRSNGSFYDKIQKYNLPKKTQGLGPKSKPVSKRLSKMPIEIPINRSSERMALIIGTPSEISKFVGELWK